MKKVLALVLALVLVLSLAACGGGSNKTQLTKDNIEKNLSITSSCDCDVETNTAKSSIFSGIANANIQIDNKTGATFEDVKITLLLESETQTWAGEDYCGWEFADGSDDFSEINDIMSKYGGANTEKTKTVEVTLPADGNWSESEKLYLKLYADKWELYNEPDKIDKLNITVKDVSGSVTLEQDNAKKIMNLKKLRKLRQTKKRIKATQQIMLVYGKPLIFA